MIRCLGPDCEGWELQLTDRYCPHCGRAQYPALLTCKGGPVLQPGKGILEIVFQGQAGYLDLSQLQLPDWMQAQAYPLQLEPGQCWQITVDVLTSSPEGLPGQVVLGESRLEVWSSPPAQVELIWDKALINPQCRQVRGWLKVLAGALWVPQLPSGWSCSENLPLVLSQRAFSCLQVWAPAQSGDIRWDLGSVLVESHLECSFAGILECPKQQQWCLTSSPGLQIPLRSSQGAVEIERIESPLDLNISFPHWLTGDGFLQLDIGEQAPEPGMSWLDLILVDGRRQRICLEITRPEHTDYEGWLLLDLGSTFSTAALWSVYGQLIELPLDGEAMVLPSGLAYFAHQPPLPAGETAPNVVMQAKRYLGLVDFKFRLILPETHQVIYKAPEEVLVDFIEVLLERVQRAPQLLLKRLKRMCLAHPAAFSPRQIHLLRTTLSARLGLELQLSYEPVAAACDFLADRVWPEREWSLLLYDFGGATSDVALLKVDSRRAASMQVSLQHVGGDRWFGGQDITELQASLLAPAERYKAEQIKKQQLMRAQLDPLVEPHLPLSLPEGEVCPDLIVVSGQGALYPLIAEWLQQQFPGVLLEAALRPKQCVVRGLRFHPEVIRSGPPRGLTEGSRPLMALAEINSRVCTTRLGIKLMGAGGAYFKALISPGQVLPFSTSLEALPLLSGDNWLEVVENLGWETRVVLPDGTLNEQLITLERLKLTVDSGLDPDLTILHWTLSVDYKLSLRLEHAATIILEVGPLALWPD